MRVIAALRQHVGRENAASAADLAAAIGLPRRQSRRIRRIISDALLDGTFEDLEMPLCAAPSAGFFIASTYCEARDYIALCRSLAHEARRKTQALDRLYHKAFGLHFDL